MESTNIQIGAYYFPGYHPDPKVSLWHGKNWTEWELVKAARPRFNGHSQPKLPLWGYEDESLPAVMQRKAEAASRHGISHFIYDWYYYEDGDFLNRSLDEGFLGIPGGPPIKFALMWANHDWLNIQPARLDGQNPIMLRGDIGRQKFDLLADTVIRRYFLSPHYWRIADCPYFSIYDLPNFIKGLGGVAEAADALQDFRRKARAAGLKDLHLNLVHWQNTIVGSERQVEDARVVIGQLGFDSLSSYVWIHHYKGYTFPETDYNSVLEFNEKYWEDTRSGFPIPYFPNVTMGWDATPRTLQTDAYENRGYPYMPILSNNTPENFKKALLAARSFVERSPQNLRHFSINAWNEWTEGSYLEPDPMTKYAYLEAVREVANRNSDSR